MADQAIDIFAYVLLSEIVAVHVVHDRESMVKFRFAADLDCCLAVGFVEQADGCVSQARDFDGAAVPCVDGGVLSAREYAAILLDEDSALAMLSSRKAIEEHPSTISASVPHRIGAPSGKCRCVSVVVLELQTGKKSSLSCRVIAMVGGLTVLIFLAKDIR